MLFLFYIISLTFFPAHLYPPATTIFFFPLEEVFNFSFSKPIYLKTYFISSPNANSLFSPLFSPLCRPLVLSRCPDLLPDVRAEAPYSS